MWITSGSIADVAVIWANRPTPLSSAFQFLHEPDHIHIAHAAQPYLLRLAPKKQDSAMGLTSSRGSGHHDCTAR